MRLANRAKFAGRISANGAKSTSGTLAIGRRERARELEVPLDDVTRRIDRHGPVDEPGCRLLANDVVRESVSIAARRWRARSTPI